MPDYQVQPAWQQWKARYRPAFGCNSVGACWCDVCRALSRAWEDAMRIAISGVDSHRHPRVRETDGITYTRKPPKRQEVSDE